MDIPVYTISIPEYNIKKYPDSGVIGRKVDEVLKKHFMGRRLAIRAIGSSEHKGKTVDQLIAIIKQQGTDRYDPGREGDRYENLDNRNIDLFALVRTVTPRAKIFWQFVWSFYDWPTANGAKPTRIDLVILYDPKALKRVHHTYDGKRYKRDGFVFKSSNKRKALRGFIKVS